MSSRRIKEQARRKAKTQTRKDGNDKEGDVRKFSPSPSIGSKICQQILEREAAVRHGPRGLSEIIVSKINPTQVPQTQEGVKKWLQERRPQSNPELTYDYSGK